MDRDYTVPTGKIETMSDSARPAPPSHDDVMTVLRQVIDPELGADIVSLGMVPGVTVEADGLIRVGITTQIQRDGMMRMRDAGPVRTILQIQRQRSASAHYVDGIRRIAEIHFLRFEASQGDDRRHIAGTNCRCAEI